MIGSTRQLTVYAYGSPADMRRGFDGLYALVKQGLGADPLNGDLYLFVSRNRKRAKVLHWDGTGLCLYAKRLEAGHFARLWQRAQGETLRLTVNELQLFLEGSAFVGRVALSPPAFVQKTVAEMRSM